MLLYLLIIIPFILCGLLGYGMVKGSFITSHSTWTIGDEIISRILILFGPMFLVGATLHWCTIPIQCHKIKF